jgi:hypothetical protein
MLKPRGLLLTNDKMPEVPGGSMPGGHDHSEIERDRRQGSRLVPATLTEAVQALLAGQTAPELSATRGDMYIFSIAKNPRRVVLGAFAR